MSIKELLGTEYPIIQGALAQISNHQLVAAVSEAGALGVIASAGLTAEELREEIKQCRKLTDKSFGVNLMLQMANCDELVEIIIEEEIGIVTTSAGNPKSLLPRLHQAGVKVIPVIGTVDHALKMQALGVEAVIAEGEEAGGHVGSNSSILLIPQVVDRLNIPVIGAGGIRDGRAVAAMYVLGAEAVQVGSLFSTSEECPISNTFKGRLLNTNHDWTSHDSIPSFNLGMLEKLPNYFISEDDFMNETGGDLQSNIRPVKNIVESLYKEAKLALKNTEI